MNRRQTLRLKRHRRVRRRVVGTTARPRLAVFRSLAHIYVQVIDDTAGETLAAASTLDPTIKGAGKKGGDIEAAKAVGALIATRAKEKGVEKVVFDRGGYQYHGRVAQLADAAREGGLSF